MKALVLGASGFVGANVVRALLKRGYAVRAMTRSKSDTRSLREIQKDIEFVHGDLDDVDSLVKAMSDCPVVFHAAGYLPTHAREARSQIAVAAQQLKNAFEAARQANVEKMVYTSSFTTIGRPPQKGRLANEADAYVPSPRDHVYYRVKHHLEEMALNAAYRTGLPVVVVNPTVCFGPYDTRPVIGNMFILYKRWKMPFYAPGTINVVDVRDVAEGHVLALEKGRVGDRYLLGHLNLTGKDLMQTACRIMRTFGAILPAPFPLLYLLAWLTEAAVRNKPGRFPLLASEFVAMFQHGSPLNTARAVQALGMPQSPIEQAMLDDIRWLRRVKKI